jgi:hypothetical protein
MSEEARALRTAMRWALLIAAAGLALIFAATQAWVPKATVVPALLLFLLGSAASIWLGFRSHQRALADRARGGRLAMIIAIAAQLGKQDDATLARIAAQSGPAGEAARMLMAERRKRQTPGTPGPEAR